MRRRKEEAVDRQAGLHLTHALRLVASAGGVAEALAEVLREAVAALQAEGGAVIEMPSAAIRTAHELDERALQALLLGEGGAAAALADPDGWVSGALTVQQEGREFTLYPATIRGSTAAALVVLGGSVAQGEATALAFASLVALLLENGRLYDEAREALQAREHFLVALNHELRTPATALMLEAEMLSGGIYGDLPPRLVRALQDTEGHLEEMVAVLRRVLDLGKLGDQANPERPEVVQVRETVLALLRQIEPAAKRKNLSLAVFVPPTLPALQTDVPRFSRVLLHLLSNAVKYTAKGGIEVRIARGMRRVGAAKPEPLLSIRIRDTGRGIPHEEMERMFEPFAQVEEGARTDSRQRGLGLGLPLARQMARSLGGEVTIDSEVGVGTTATLEVPFRFPAGVS